MPRSWHSQQRVPGYQLQLQVSNNDYVWGLGKVKLITGAVLGAGETDVRNGAFSAIPDCDGIITV